MVTARFSDNEASIVFANLMSVNLDYFSHSVLLQIGSLSALLCISIGDFDFILKSFSLMTLREAT